MLNPATGTENRLIFFDNLRFWVVLCVVFQHSSNAYNGLAWWPVADDAASTIAEWVNAFIDAFAMPFLFYIAGYFALPALRKNGVCPFLKGKLKRLGIPWLVCILTICPIVPLVYHLSRSDFSLATGYWNIWSDLMRHAAEFNVGIISSMTELMQNNQFYQRYMWFLSVLILFFFIFCAIYLLNRNWFEDSEPRPAMLRASVSSTLKIMVTVGLLTFICSSVMINAMFFLVPGLTNPEPFFTLGNVIQFRPSRIFLFVIYFTLGVLTFKRRWIERGRFPGHLTTWLVSFAVTAVAFFYARNLMLNGPADLKKFLGPVVFWFCLNFLTITTVGLATSLALKYWDRPTAVNRSLASNSYNIYLAHYIFVIGFQLLLLTAPGVAGWLKFSIVSSLSIAGSYIVCEYVIKPFPRVAVGVAFILFGLMLVAVNP